MEFNFICKRKNCFGLTHTAKPVSTHFGRQKFSAPLYQRDERTVLVYFQQEKQPWKSQIKPDDRGGICQYECEWISAF